LGQIREITKAKSKTAEVERGRHHFTKDPLVAKRSEWFGWTAWAFDGFKTCWKQNSNDL